MLRKSRIVQTPPGQDVRKKSCAIQIPTGQHDLDRPQNRKQESVCHEDLVHETGIWSDLSDLSEYIICAKWGSVGVRTGRR